MLLSWQQGSVGGKFKWPRWIGRAWKPYLRTKNYESMLCTTKVMIIYIQGWSVGLYYSLNWCHILLFATLGT